MIVNLQASSTLQGIPTRAVSIDYVTETRRQFPSHSIKVSVTVPSSYLELVDPRELKEAVQVPFDPYGTDTMVYVHVQKTGGSEFLEHLVMAQMPLERVRLGNDSGELPEPEPSLQAIPLCRTSPIGGWLRKDGHLANGPGVMIHHELCPRDWDDRFGDTWLVSEKTTAWSCGVHPFYTDFNKCLQNATAFNQYVAKRYKRRVMRLSKENHFHYVVILRHPLLRYISEYLHVLRGACWPRRTGSCSSSGATRKKFIFPDRLKCKKDIVKKFAKNMTLEKFANSTNSWSINRMTLSLATDYKLVNCWDKKECSREQRDQQLLTSAKSNLRNFSYFGLNEFIAESGTLFEKTFGMVLKNPIQTQPFNVSRAGQLIGSITFEDNSTYKKVVRNNLLDLELYEYALELFRTRLRKIGQELDADTLNYIQTLSDTMHQIA